MASTIRVRLGRGYLSATLPDLARVCIQPQGGRLNPIAQRVAQNDALFREANERIERAAGLAGVELVPFICECADERCTELVTLSLDQYEHVRRDSTLFLNVAGHEESAMGWAQVVERHDGFAVVAKIGEAAEIVEDLDSRQASE